MQRIMCAVIVAIALVSPRDAAARGEHGRHCRHCGATADCCKVCQLKCEEAEVEITCWGCKCEEFCIPDRSCPGCRHCEVVCEDCDCAGDPNEPHAVGKWFVWRDWCPGTAQVYPRKKLMYKVITRKVPVYKWEVVDLCPACIEQCAPLEVPAGAEVPPPPSGAGVVVPYHTISPAAPASR